ncbi:hypothetical protein [Myxacorys almedinensis]|uniref:EcsC family protein n=1 Tax=Myxacorys almedinensis A TaxID=2690445 RepID=A0A8J8CN81_9CYAN|nr:hypothetical protein [Myxacorys almedinensis]NDJ18137.1 hypothetical protein [Myxacorys almedinensis A]
MSNDSSQSASDQPQPELSQTPSDLGAVRKRKTHLLGGVAETALKTGEGAIGAALWLGNIVTKQMVRLIGTATQGAGEAVGFVGNLPLLRNPIVKRLAGVLKLDWLTGMSDRVDTTKAEAAVREFQRKYPDESPSQITHRLMVKKAFQAGSSGFVTSMLPGFATALLALDLAATTALQTELVYEIAAAYGLDLQDSARKGEVLAIFGLAVGGGNALKAGLGFLRNIPLAGAMIGASTNATMLYSLGYAASQFYEAKLRDGSQEPSTEALEAIQQRSEQYLSVAIAQQAVMDQILVHMILASYPEKSWEDILPELRKMQIEQDSLNGIAANIKAPQPLSTLVDQLNCDFAIPLLAQCRRIAQSNDAISAQAAKVLTAIEEKCDADDLLESLEP